MQRDISGELVAEEGFSQGLSFTADGAERVAVLSSLAVL